MIINQHFKFLGLGLPCGDVKVKLEISSFRPGSEYEAINLSAAQKQNESWQSYNEKLPKPDTLEPLWFLLEDSLMEKSVNA